MNGSSKQLIDSMDGTPIAIWRTGSGPPLVLVHGMIADHSTTWRLVLPELSRWFTVYAMDRRGRGGSGNAPEYELRHEAEDVAAVVDTVRAPVCLLGHSFGGLCALEATLLTEGIERLIVYEGVFLRGADFLSETLISTIEDLLGAGRTEDALVFFLREGADLTEPEIELLRSNPDAWQLRLDNAWTIPREWGVQRRYEFEEHRFRNMRAPTLLLVGSESPSRVLRAAHAVARALPDARVSEMAGQEHIAMYTAPDLFVEEVVRFAGRWEA